MTPPLPQLPEFVYCDNYTTYVLARNEAMAVQATNPPDTPKLLAAIMGKPTVFPNATGCQSSNGKTLSYNGKTYNIIQGKNAETAADVYAFMKGSSFLGRYWWVLLIVALVLGVFLVLKFKK